MGVSIMAGATVASLAGAASPRDGLVQLGLQLANLNSRQCLTVTGGGLDDNAIVIQQPCRRDASFRWRFVAVGRAGTFLIENVRSGRCLTVAGDSVEDNGFAVQFRCANADPSQQWRVRRPAGALLTVPAGQALLENGRSHRCLTIAGGSVAAGGVAVQYACDQQRSRQWSVRIVAGPALE
ncbi:RICIN domain-containing protein [Actinoplanes sp. CA-030573]|uniref:RICIN domain-containing protein n=1 Tax=Actinoplanes sp. CA-030573 TaxID=3239898 RepID=UPI003D8BB746